MHKNILRASVCAALVLAAATSASAACYAVYNRKGQLVQQTALPPVDMSYQLHRTVPGKFGRGSVVVFEAPLGGTCYDFFAKQDKRKGKTIQDTTAILDNLARLHTDPRGQIGRTDQWLADVQVK